MRRIAALSLLALLPALAGAADLAQLIRSGDRAAALAAIGAGADVNAPLPDGSSPLLWAVTRVDQELVKTLLQRGADPNARNALGATALTEAIALNEQDVVSALLAAKADPNLGNADNQTPLMIAARMGALPVVQALLKAGARVNERENYREQSALMWAIGANSPAIVDLLIAHKADVDFRAASSDWNQITSEPRAQYRPAGGLTPLLYAARFGCLACVKSLLQAGADINRPTPEGVTPLMNALDNNQYAVANLLLDQGANPHLADWWGRTALYLSVDMRTRGGAPRGGPGAPGGPDADSIQGVQPTDAAQPPPQNSALQVMQRLLEMGVDPNTQLNMHRPFRGRFTDDLITTGCTPLLRAALSVDREAVAMLLKHGALPDLPNVMGVTPIMAAAGMGYLVGASGGGQGPIAGSDPQTNSIAVIDMLIKAGADVNARVTDTISRTAIIARPSSMTDRQGQTALFAAVGNGSGSFNNGRSWTRVAKFLIDNGARLDIKDAAGKTVLDALEGKAGGRDLASTEEMKKLIAEAMLGSGA